MCCPHCPHCCPNPAYHADVAAPRRRGGGLVSMLFKTLLVYVALVFAGGTLINTHHPVAVEAGRLIHTVTLVDPATHWFHSHGWHYAAHGLQIVSQGVEFS